VVGRAAGGWLQVAAKTLPVSSLIIGVDLVPIRAVRGAKTLVGDITTQQTRQVRRGTHGPGGCKLHAAARMPAASRLAAPPLQGRAGWQHLWRGRRGMLGRPHV
jgi:hypothetical protein